MELKGRQLQKALDFVFPLNVDGRVGGGNEIEHICSTSSNQEVVATFW
jgi:hypothetical protein